MREIKFRAWHKTNKLMLVHRDIPIGLKNINNKNSGWVYMQWTGLKDKNGVEIYEGDLMRVVLPQIVRSEQRWDGNEIYEVEIEDAPEIEIIAEVRINPKHTKLLVRKAPRDALISCGGRLNINKKDEVIGNIHESPELLEVG